MSVSTREEKRLIQSMNLQAHSGIDEILGFISHTLSTQDTALFYFAILFGSYQWIFGLACGRAGHQWRNNCTEGPGAKQECTPPMNVITDGGRGGRTDGRGLLVIGVLCF